MPRWRDLTSHLREWQRPHGNPEELELHLAQRVHPAFDTNNAHIVFSNGNVWLMARGSVGRILLGYDRREQQCERRALASSQSTRHVPGITRHLALQAIKSNAVYTQFTRTVPLQALKLHTLYPQLHVMYKRYRLKPRPFSRGQRKVDHSSGC